MILSKKASVLSIILSALILVFGSQVGAQNKLGFEILSDGALTRVVPSSFYFAGQSAATQMRNAAAAQIGRDRFVIAGLVDTSGYSTEISGKYEGFLITDSPIKVGGRSLGTGAYGFGFSKDGKLNIFDLSSRRILSAAAKFDDGVRRPRPLEMVLADNGVKLYKGKSYVLISPR